MKTHFQFEVTLRLRNHRKRWFLGPQFVGGTPYFGHAFSNYIYFRPCDRIWLSSVQRVPRVADEKKKKERKKESIPGKI